MEYLQLQSTEVQLGYLGWILSGLGLSEGLSFSSFFFISSSVNSMTMSAGIELTSLSSKVGMVFMSSRVKTHPKNSFNQMPLLSLIILSL